MNHAHGWPGSGLWILLLFVGAGCVTTSRSVYLETEEVLARHNIEVKVPKGWKLIRSPIHFYDSLLLNLRSGDGMVLNIEVSPPAVQDLEARVRQVRDGYCTRYPDGRFHEVAGAVGPHPARGFDGTVLDPGGTGRRLNLLFRCFNTEDRHVSIQGQANAVVWKARRADIRAILENLRVGERPD